MEIMYFLRHVLKFFEFSLNFLKSWYKLKNKLAMAWGSYCSNVIPQIVNLNPQGDFLTAPHPKKCRSVM